MEIIPGSGNWRLILRREAEGITVLRAATCDKRAVLPETLCGLPVTALGDHALSPTAAPAEGEELLVTDLGSTNGSTILREDGSRENLVPETPTVLPAGARLTLGDRTLSVERVQ